MGRPSLAQIAQAIILSAHVEESDADFDARIAGLSRLSDAELAAMGIYPPPPSPEPKKAPRKPRNS